MYGKKVPLLRSDLYRSLHTSLTWWWHNIPLRSCERASKHVEKCNSVQILWLAINEFSTTIPHLTVPRHGWPLISFQTIHLHFLPVNPWVSVPRKHGSQRTYIQEGMKKLLYRLALTSWKSRSYELGFWRCGSRQVRCWLLYSYSEQDKWKWLVIWTSGTRGLFLRRWWWWLLYDDYSEVVLAWWREKVVTEIDLSLKLQLAVTNDDGIIKDSPIFEAWKISLFL